MLRFERQRRRVRKKILGFLLIFVIIGVFFIVSTFILSSISNHTKNVPVVTPIPTTLPSNTPTLATISPPGNDSLSDVVQRALIGTHGKYGAVIKNIKTGESYSLNEHTTFDSGSLYKLWVMVEVYKKIKTGVLTEDQILSEDIATLNKKFHIDPKIAEKTEGTEKETVADALYQMITISDNYAALLLTEKIGLSNVTSFLKTNGLTESKVGTNGDLPKTTPSNIALFFEKLYEGELADETYTNKMLSLLKTQRLNDKIPKYLPDNIGVAHKTGELDYVTHDAGIVYAPTGDYIIVILSQSDDPDKAEERIANVSKAVFDYFSHK